jgi:hypothetical protein
MDKNKTQMFSFCFSILPEVHDNFAKLTSKGEYRAESLTKTVKFGKLIFITV